MTWTLEVLSTEASDKKRWRGYVDALPTDKKYVYLLPEYAALLEQEFNEPTFLFRYGDAQDAVMMVGVKRSLSELDFYQSDREPGKPVRWDVSSPVGYGGPIVSTRDKGTEQNLFRGFRERLHHYFLENGIVTEFLRLNPLTQNHELFGSNSGLRQKNATVWLDLEESESELLSGMTSNRRADIRKAQSAEVEIIISELQEDDLKEFHRLYIQTMERLGALPIYFFSLDFFQNLASSMAGESALFLGMWSGRVISAQLFLHAGHSMEYYLSASEWDERDLHASSLGIYQAALWAKTKGYKYLHLGGGHAFEQDSLYKFKSQFSPHRAPYYMYQEIHDQEGYTLLSHLKQQYDEAYTETKVSEQNNDAVLKDYFPAYRG